MSQQSSAVRGGTPPDRSVFQKRGLKKAAASNVVADITGRGVLAGAEAPAAQPETTEPIHLQSAPPAAQDRLHLAPEPVLETRAAQPAPVEQPSPAHVQQQPVQQYVPAPTQQPSQQPTQQAPVPPLEAAQPAPVEQPASEPAKKTKDTGKKVGFYQPEDAGDRMRAAFIATRHLTGYRTLSDFICSVVEAEVQQLEERYNEGKPFATEPNGVPRGRPIG